MIIPARLTARLSIDPENLRDKLCFCGIRVPLAALLDTLDDCMEFDELIIKEFQTFT